MTRLLEAWRRTLKRCGERRAIVQTADGRSATFAQLDAGARAWLAAQPLPSSDMAGRAVVFAEPNGIRWLEIFLGIVRAGGIAVPLDAAEPPMAQRAIAESVRAGFSWDRSKLIPLEGARRFRDPALCLIKLTSGTTGRPRPLVFTAAQMLGDARQVTTTMGIRAADLNYALIPFGHSYGLGNLTLPLLAHGVPIICGASPLPQAIAEDFARWKPTVLPSVPAVFRALAAAEIPPERFATLRLAISAGAPLPPETARDFLARYGRRIHAFYGSSETGGIAYDRDGAATLAGGVGWALRGVRIEPRRGQRIQISSAAVFTHGNSRHRDAHGAWLPPDRVAIDARGNLTLLGRRGTTVKLAGRRVNLMEVAARLRRLSGVRDVWVGTSANGEPQLGAALATSRSSAELRAELMADTAAWKIPKRWAVMSEFPITARGKIDTRGLHALVFPR